METESLVQSTGKTNPKENPVIKAEGNTLGLQTMFASVTEEKIQENIKNEENLNFKVENKDSDNEKSVKRRRINNNKSDNQVLCSECGATCNKNSLKLHKKRWHSNDKPNPRKLVNKPKSLCPVCGKLMSSNSNLQKHIEQVHGILKR